MAPGGAGPELAIGGVWEAGGWPRHTSDERARRARRRDEHVAALAAAKGTEDRAVAMMFSLDALKEDHAALQAKPPFILTPNPSPTADADPDSNLAPALDLALIES